MITINWLTRVIYIPQAYLTNLGGGKYELDVDQFRLDLKDIEDSEEGIAFPHTNEHNTEALLSGTTYARQVKIVNGYTIEFENGIYTVKCTGANHNIEDVKIVNSVSLIVNNSAGLINGGSGGGSPTAIASAVWDELLSAHNIPGTTGAKLAKLLEKIQFLYLKD